MDLREIGIDGANWIRLAPDKVQRAFVSTVMNIRIPYRKQVTVDNLSDYQLFKKHPDPWSK
jgi:hypothetical protein